MPTRSETIAADVAALLRARNPLLWVVTREEGRAESYLFEAAAAAGYVARTWDVGQGVADIGGRLLDIGSPDPSDTLNQIRDRAKPRGAPERGVWIMRDLPAWLVGPAMAATCRQVRNLARSLPGIPRESAQALIVLSPVAEVPPELAGARRARSRRRARRPSLASSQGINPPPARPTAGMDRPSRLAGVEGPRQATSIGSKGAKAMWIVRYRRLGWGCNSYVDSYHESASAARAYCRRRNSKPFTPFFWWAERN